MGHKTICCWLFLTMLYLELILADDLMNSRKKNDTARYSNRHTRIEEPTEENALSLEAVKFLKQCGGGDNRSDVKSQNNMNTERNIWQRNDQYSNSNRNQQSYNSHNNNNQHDSAKQYPNYQDTSYHNKRTAYPGRNYGNDNTQYTHPNPYASNNDRDYNSDNRYSGYNPNDNQQKSQCGTNNGNYGDNRQGYNNKNDQNPYRFLNVFRSKRFNNSNDGDVNVDEDSECVSQCIFEYLQLLDDDRMPAESLFIKWLQENATGSDMDRIKNLREARLCFARLAATDIDDGCQFSKELANCLNLNIE